MASVASIFVQAPKILIVENEPALRLLVATVLEDDGGFDLLMADSADQAFKFIALHDGIDCVFTDVNMPGRFDGLGLAKGVLADHPAMPGAQSDKVSALLATPSFGSVKLRDKTNI